MPPLHPPLSSTRGPRRRRVCTAHTHTHEPTNKHAPCTPAVVALSSAHLRTLRDVFSLRLSASQGLP